MRIVLSNSKLVFMGRNTDYFPESNVPESALYQNQGILAGFIDWQVLGADNSISVKLTGFPAAAVGNSLEIFALEVQTMETGVRYPVISLGSISIDSVNAEKTLALSGLTEGKKYWILIRSNSFVPYNTNSGKPYKACSGSYHSADEDMSCSTPGQSGEGSYGQYIPANIQIKAIP